MIKINKKTKVTKKAKPKVKKKPPLIESIKESPEIKPATAVDIMLASFATILSTIYTTYAYVNNMIYKPFFIVLAISFLLVVFSWKEYYENNN
tara:strand:- start:5894 stop:6172 length:279 start_codon:yes stop_codon:yes gene_type:complete